jgi:DNA polymerase III sliding clamp (beta) subunit (PCNA family)
VTLTLEFFRFLQAVVDREWVGLIVNDKLVTAAGEDFGVLATPVEETFPPWQRSVPDRAGYWVVDKEALRQAIRDAQTLGSEQVTLAVDSIGDRLIVKARGKDATYETTLPARRRGGPPAVRLAVHPRYLLDAVEATGGGLVRLGFDEDGGEFEPLTVRGEEEDFLAVIMPIRT